MTRLKLTSLLSIYLLDISEIKWALLITHISNNSYFTNILVLITKSYVYVVIAKFGWILFFFLLRVTLCEIYSATLWFNYLSQTRQEIWEGRLELRGSVDTHNRVFIFNMSSTH